MRIAFYAPFKPIDHPHPSGDVMTGRNLVDFLGARGNHIQIISKFRSRWIYLRPLRWPGLMAEFRRVVKKLQRHPPDLWLTYHSYYKGPDLLGTLVCRYLKIPYVIFQGIYATKYRRKLKTWPGFILNRFALQSAGHVFANKRRDWHNLKRLLPPDKLSYVAPGINVKDFSFSSRARRRLRQQWNMDNGVLVMTAAMFRPDVKTRGLMAVIRACGRLRKDYPQLHLLIVGGGQTRRQIETAAAKYMPERTIFAGQIPRSQMYQYYSAADLFAFPGINEALGLVYLEAQACGLPVVAYDNAGVAEAVRHMQGGLLAPLNDEELFGEALKKLIRDQSLRRRMGIRAKAYVHQHHDLNHNYHQLIQKIETIR